jgi:hypothetical protein
MSLLGAITRRLLFIPMRTTARFSRCDGDYSIKYMIVQKLRLNRYDAFMKKLRPLPLIPGSSRRV